MQKNIKIYSIYKIFSYDIFFYYAISFFFFTTVKHFTVSQILLLEALYPLYGTILQIPSGIIVQKFGIKNSMVFGNFLWMIGYIIYIIAPNIFFIIVADIIFAIGNSVKQITESSFLFDNLKSKKRESEYNKIEGKGIAMFYYIETITSILAGFLFVVNPYLPFVLGTLMCLISTCIAIQFKEPKYKPQIEYKSFKEQVKTLKEGIRDTLKSKRLQALILYASFFIGFISINSTYYVNFLKNLGVDVENYTLIFAILAIIHGISSQNQYIIERKTRKKTLKILSILFSLTLITIGIIGTLNISKMLIIGIVICIVIIQKIIEGTYEVSISRYMVNFTTTQIAPNILATYNFFKNIGQSLLLFLGALLISKANINNSYIILGTVTFIVMTILILFMKNKVGLEPKEEEEKL